MLLTDADRNLNRLKLQLHRGLANLEYDQVNQEESLLRRTIEGMVEDLLEGQSAGADFAQDDLVDQMLAEALRLGPLQVFFADPSITEIMVNGPRQVFIERHGQLSETDVQFRDDEHLLETINRILGVVGRRCDKATPRVDSRLPDGSRVNAIIPPISLRGPALCIRRFGADPLTWNDYLSYKTCTTQMRDFLSACVQAKMNILVVGGTGSGKSTLLNNLSSFVGDTERIVSIEDAAELQLRQPNVVQLESRPADSEGNAAVSIRELLINSLHMRPDRIVIGECRGAETFDMLQAMNTGHDGSMTTIHANTCRDAIARIESMVMMAGTELSSRAIRRQFASAINLIVQMERMAGGARRITSISEVMGTEGDVICMQELFAFEQEGIDGDGNAYGRFVGRGIRPACANRFTSRGIDLDPSIFAFQETVGND